MASHVMQIVEVAYEIAIRLKQEFIWAQKSKDIGPGLREMIAHGSDNNSSISRLSQHRRASATSNIASTTCSTAHGCI